MRRCEERELELLADRVPVADHTHGAQDGAAVHQREEVHGVESALRVALWRTAALRGSPARRCLWAHTHARSTESAHREKVYGVGVHCVRPCGRCLSASGSRPSPPSPVPHMVHGLSSAPGGRCTVWQCTMCGHGPRQDVHQAVEATGAAGHLEVAIHVRLRHTRCIGSAAHRVRGARCGSAPRVWP